MGTREHYVAWCDSLLHLSLKILNSRGKQSHRWGNVEAELLRERAKLLGDF